MGRGRAGTGRRRGPNLLGIRFAIAESYERIHRSNLVGMGILPLQFQAGESVETYCLTGEELFTLGEPGQLRAMLEDGFGGGEEPYGDGDCGGWRGDACAGDDPDRYAAGDFVLPAWGGFCSMCCGSWRGRPRTGKNVSGQKSAEYWLLARGAPDFRANRVASLEEGMASERGVV